MLDVREKGVFDTSLGVEKEAALTLIEPFSIDSDAVMFSITDKKNLDLSTGGKKKLIFEQTSMLQEEKLLKSKEDIKPV